jgi:hypothetical protein
VPVKPGEEKPKWLSKEERAQFTLSKELKEILIGLCLGDLHIRKEYANARLYFVQGAPNKEYLDHLYELFSSYCGTVPKTSIGALDKRTGVRHTSIRFNTLSLPCFNELYNLFVVNGVKTVPLNMGDLLTPLSLAYWIGDDGCFCQRDRAIILSTQGFSLQEVELLTKVLTDKFNLKCSVNKSRNAFIIRISPKSLKDLQSLLKDVMPRAMLHKIGL